MLDKDRKDIERLHKVERQSKKKYSNIRKRENWLKNHPIIKIILLAFLFELILWLLVTSPFWIENILN